MDFITGRFMIDSEVGVRLYKEVAAKLPIIDYHCHLDAKEIYENKKFDNITQLWLAGDHYKWRAMRANGIAERYITGDATPEEKFKAYAETVEAAFGNPLYHWTHLELNKYFSCNEMLDSDNWQEIMNHCNQLIGGEDFKPRSLITRSNVEVICTTDAPLDTLEYHRLLQQGPTFTTRVLPTFRPDDIFAEGQVLATFIDRLAQVTGRDIHTYADFTAAMAERIDFFHEVGCRISD
ncbi:glucuronate isomerase, partial [Salmonella enterica]|nr:glucuronate isomerase [Salmonella enterica]